MTNPWADLHHIALGSPDPERLAGFYGRAMGFQVSRQGDALICRGRQRRLVIVEGPAKSLAYAAYAVDGLEALGALEARLQAHGQPSAPSCSHLFGLEAVCAQDPDGNRIVFGLPPAEEDAAFAGLAAVPARLQHVVLASRDAARAVRFYEQVIGFTLSDNVVDEAGAIRTSFLRGSHEHHNFAVFQAPEDRLDHHCYEAGDWGLIRDWADHMAAERIPLKWGPGRHGPGNNLFIFVHDPDGNWVEISAELETVEPGRPAGIWPHEERTLNTWGVGLLRS